MAEYIKRDNVIDEIDRWLDSVGTALIGKGLSYYGELIGCVEDAPAADVAPVVHGRWEECDYVEPCIHGFGTIRHANAGLKCTNCVNVFKKELLWKDNYFPNCGALMQDSDA